jgi:hypothetical protein
MIMIYRHTVRMWYVIVPMLIVLFISSFISVHAQGVPPSLTQEEFAKLSDEEKARILSEIRPPSIQEVKGNTPGAVSCFDYYTFGSVDANISPYTHEVYTTDPVLFGGTVENKNPYPIVDGQLWMKVFKQEQSSPEDTKENGYPMVDFVLVKDNIVLPAQGNIPVDFSWTVPTYASEGDYMVAFFFTTAHRFNLLGLSFTDDVTGNTATFSVKRTTPYTPVVFDKNNVMFSTTLHSFALPPRHFAKDAQVVAYANLVNDSAEDRIVSVVWKTYVWDGILEKHRIEVKPPMLVSIPAHSKKEVGYETPMLPTAVTYVIAEAYDHDATSTLHMRYVRDNIPETRINFPSLMHYPLKKGEETTLFSCVHATNVDLVPDSTLTLTLTHTGTGDILRTYTYTGDVTGAMMAVKDSFIPEKDYSNVTLTATLAKNNEVVDEVSIVYTCDDIDPTLCISEEQSAEDMLNVNPSFLPLVPLVVTIASLGVLGALFYYRIRTRTKKEEVVDETRMHIPTQE